MKTTILTLTVLAFAFLGFNNDVLAQAKAKVPKDKVLANKVFTVEMSETTGKKVAKTVPDEISFKSEKLGSKFITKEVHFPAAVYTVVEVDSSVTPWVVTFISEGKNTDGEDIKLEGTVTGEEIDGTATVSKKGKVKKEFAYTGSLKTKGAKK